jgi:hypothetical protein
MNAVCQLYQDGGVSGPSGTISTTPEKAVEDAIEWSEGQIGHPWDGILVNVYEDEDEGRCNPIETHQIEMRDGAWECV